jgi:hypothetical protein
MSYVTWDRPLAAPKVLSFVESSSSNILTIVRPVKAGMFSGKQSHRGKSGNPVAWVAFVRETKRMKPTDKAILGMVSESPGRNVSEPRGGLDKIDPKAEPSMVGRRLHGMTQADRCGVMPAERRGLAAQAV